MKATTMKRKRLLASITLLCLWGMASPEGFAQTDMKRGSLRGLKGLGVVVEELQPEAERDGLTKSQLRTDVELKLRQAGLRVLSPEESLKEPGSPYLYVNLNTAKSEVLYAFATYAYALQVALKQEVTLTRDPDIRGSATTWDTGVLGTVGAANLPDLRKTLSDVLDRFINDYLAANPK
jgi:hypothetical protein